MYEKHGADFRSIKQVIFGDIPSIITGQMEICDLKVGEALGTPLSTCRKKPHVFGLKLRM